MNLRRVFRQKNLFYGGLIVALVTLMAIFAPLIAPFDPINDADLLSAELPPDATHLFGTDTSGRDAFSRVVYGAQVSLSVGLITQIANTIIGVSLGLVAGYFGRFWDELIMGATNIMLSIPVIVFALAIMSALGPGLFNIYLALGLTNWSYTCRLTRAQVLSIKKSDYVNAAVVLGYSKTSIIFGQIMPNVLGPVLVIATLGCAEAILMEAALSFLGLGAQPPMPSWGGMLSSSRDLFFTAPWLSIFPGLAIFITVLGLNLFGDGLRDILDPRSVLKNNA
ncbi:ABC transporter permease [Ensifer sp. 1H6]|uniref:ABC transporter permease n=1 Tax=Ensifer sp. 1H6 TaxID=1911585 RepID=UPI00042EA2B6|nr:ABC transporter permease [Ensifer sp. 1H6]AHK47215.1 putative transmembrane component of ABC transporter [Ensifer adhaerens OV14]OMQ42986.1 peptide ABC transporter permease [Ensifer sp. 1H6]